MNNQAPARKDTGHLVKLSHWAWLNIATPRSSRWPFVCTRSIPILPILFLLRLDSSCQLQYSCLTGMFRVLEYGSGRIHFRRTLPTKVHIAARRLRVSSTRNKLELFETFSSHPLMLAVTGGGGVTLMAALYRNPQFLKLIGEATRDRSVLVLPQKPSHDYQSRKKELETLSRMVKQLKSSHKGVANVVYVTGQPGHGKTQLASEFARTCYKKGRGLVFRKQFVGTLNASSQSSLIHSYITLAIELGCNNELSSLKDLTGLTYM